jgi:starch synthase
MSKTRILYVSQAIQPFLPESPISKASRQIPQSIHERGREIRVFMPRFGVINERRHQLHEVIRLSGMNLNINDTDHPLIIKVASIPTARMQVYFIDNEHYFKKKVTWFDAKEKLVPDNDERAIFFARGVLETVRKLSWAPDIIHCHGWMTSLVPLYAKQMFKDDAHFANTKIITSIYDEGFEGTLNGSMIEKVQYDGIDNAHLESIKLPIFSGLNTIAMEHSDAVIMGSETLPEATMKAFNSLDVPTMPFMDLDASAAEMTTFYDSILEGKSVAVEE